MRIIPLLGIAVLAASCTSSPKLSHAFRGDGVSVRYPNGWDATSRPLTHVTDPVQVLAVASYRLPRSNRGDYGCEPKEALDRRPSDGVFIYGWEFSSPKGEKFPPRPKHFSLTDFERFGIRTVRVPRAELPVPVPRCGKALQHPRLPGTQGERRDPQDRPPDPRQPARYGRYSRPLKRSSLSKECVASIRRTVPERERMTIESVAAPSGR